MKKAFIVFTGLVLTLSAHAETATFKKVNASKATVKIVTDDKDGVQAAGYVDGQQNKQFIEMLLKDPKSKLAQLKAKIEQDNCQANSSPESTWIQDCGEVTITDAVATSFGRGGWMDAGASYTFFVGFTEQGTGRFFDVSYMVTIGEGVEADTTKDGEYAGSVTKTLSLVSIKKMPQQKNK